MLGSLFRLLAAVAAGLVLAAPASAQGPQVRFGVADDGAKYADDGGRRAFGLLDELGMTTNRITVRFDHTAPTVIQEEHGLDRLVRAADTARVELVFQVFPTSPRAFQENVEQRVQDFASYLALLARTYRSVDDFIVLNEPNEAYFQVPQFESGRNVSAAVASKVLAAGYDALKAVDPGITVIGLGLSPEGNDRTSTSPVRFLAALGRAYRASGRSKPLMDELGLHVYPLNAAAHDETTSYAWPNIGPSNLGRIKQAVWDAFEGTAQPVFSEAPEAVGPALRFVLDEVGWQVQIRPDLAHLYTFRENTQVTTEARQAEVYRALIEKLACDPGVGRVLLFHLRDEPDLRRFQSGLLRMDESRRPAFAAVLAAVGRARSCATPVVWRHAPGPIGTRVEVPRSLRAPAGALTVRPRAAEDVNVRVGVFRVGPGGEPPTAELQRLVGASRHLARGRVALVKQLVRAQRRPRLRLAGPFPPGRYVVVVRYRASVKPLRQSFRIRRLVVS